MWRGVAVGVCVCGAALLRACAWRGAAAVCVEWRLAFVSPPELEALGRRYPRRARQELLLVMALGG